MLTVLNPPNSSVSSLKGFISLIICVYDDALNSVVLYFPHLQGKQSIKASRNRYSIWCDIKKKSYKHIADYQPEVDGYKVSSISEGTHVYGDAFIS